MPTLTTKPDLDFLYSSMLGRARGGGEGEDVYLNKDYKFVATDLWNSKEATTRRTQAVQQLAALQSTIAKVQADLDGKNRVVTNLQAQVDALTTQIASLKAQAGDSTKFQTLGALLRELLGLNK